MRPATLRVSRLKLAIPFVGFVIFAAVLLLSACGNSRLKSVYHWTRPGAPAAITDTGLAAPLTPARVYAMLRTVRDPELNINIVDLGLIYNVTVSVRHVDLTMTLTTPACHFSTHIIETLKTAVFSDPLINSVDLRISFNPPWTVDRLAPEIKARLFGGNTEQVVSKKESP